MTQQTQDAIFLLAQFYRRSWSELRPTCRAIRALNRIFEALDVERTVQNREKEIDDLNNTAW